MSLNTNNNSNKTLYQLLFEDIDAGSTTDPSDYYDPSDALFFLGRGGGGGYASHYEEPAPKPPESSTAVTRLIETERRWYVTKIADVYSKGMPELTSHKATVDELERRASSRWNLFNRKSIDAKLRVEKAALEQVRKDMEQALRRILTGWEDIVVEDLTGSGNGYTVALDNAFEGGRLTRAGGRDAKTEILFNLLAQTNEPPISITLKPLEYHRDNKNPLRVTIEGSLVDGRMAFKGSTQPGYLYNKNREDGSGSSTVSSSSSHPTITETWLDIYNTIKRNSSSNNNNISNNV